MNEGEKIAQLIIARLDGNDLNKRYARYEALVKKGIGGFIIFGGHKKEIKYAVRALQHTAQVPLFIGSDLEQGLGQQIDGGTLFPPALALAGAVDREDRRDVELLGTAVRIMAEEARAVGINIIFSPVLDVNTNPDNPIICTRAFGDEPEDVAWFGRQFIRGIQREGLFACAKHFPGHGDTSSDSHRELPVLRADMKRLSATELYPFQQAIKAGVKMVMVGHLQVHALDDRFPSTLSRKTIQGLLRKKMKFEGLVITDAMNMKAITQCRAVLGRNDRLSEAKACLLALRAGADILLHPDDPEGVIRYLSSELESGEPAVTNAFGRVMTAKKALGRAAPSSMPIQSIGTRGRWAVTRVLTRKSIRVRYGGGRERAAGIPRDPVVVLIDDDNSRSGDVFSRKVRTCFPKATCLYIDNAYEGNFREVLHGLSKKTLIAGVFSRISAWKGRSGLTPKLYSFLEQARDAAAQAVLVGFCCPYVLRRLEPDVLIEAFSGEEISQEAAAELLPDL